MIRLLCLTMLALGAAVAARAQANVQWQAGNGAWFNSANWSNASVPGSSHRAVITGPEAITANGNSDVNVGALDINSSSASVLFDFSSNSNGLKLGTYASTWSAGNVEFRNGSGIRGNGIGNTALTIAHGVELLFDGSSANRSLYNLTVTNAGTIRATTGVVSVNSASVTNQLGGLIHADGAEIDFTSSTSLANLGTIRATGASGKIYFQGTLAGSAIGSVDLVSGGHAYLAGTVNNAAGVLAAPTGGSFELHGGTINGGSVASGAVTFTSSGGTLNGALLADNLALGASSRVDFTGGANFTGSSATLGNSASLYWKQVGTLAGKSVTMGTGSIIYVAGADNALTLDSLSSVTGDAELYTDGSAGTAITNLGTITHTAANSGTLRARLFTNGGTITNSAANQALYVGSTSSGYSTHNTGTITVNASGATIYLDGDVDNTGGTLEATSGNLILRGSNTVAHLTGGTVHIANGAHVYLNGTLANSGTLTGPASGIYELYGGTITGGVIAPGALTYTGTGGTLDGATVSGDLTLPGSSSVRLTGNATFSGSNLNLAASSTVYWQQSGTIAGKSLNFAQGSGVYVTGAGSALTLASDASGSGDLNFYTDGNAGIAITNHGTLTHTAATSGSIYAPSLVNDGTISNTSADHDLYIGSTSSGYATSNTGNITVNASNARVYLDGSFDNTGGTLNATNGSLVFRGSNTAAHVTGGTVNIANGAHVYLNGTITNSGTFTAPASGKYELYGGTITGGTIAPGALTFTNYGGYLDATTLNGDLSIPASTHVRLTGNAAFAGAHLDLASSASLYWQQAGTLAGKAITFGAGSQLYVAGADHTLTLAGDTSGSGELQIYSDGTSGSAITNQGTLTHTSGNSGSIYAPLFTNSGTITNTAEDGALYLGSTYTDYATHNTGHITVNGPGAYVYLDGDFDNTGGTLNATDGYLMFRGNNTAAHLNGGTVNVGANGHVYLNGTIDNSAATLHAPVGGSYELYGGTINHGTVAANALGFTSYGGYLSDVTLLGNVTLASNAYARFADGTNLGTANAALNLGPSAGLEWRQSGTLTGNSLSFGTGAYLYVTGSDHSLTLGPGTTATGDIDITGDGSAGNSLTNYGTITHTGGSGSLYSLAFTNAGTIDANGGTLYIGTSSTGATVANNAGATIRLNGGNVSLQVPAANPVVNHGTIDIVTGTFYTNNHLNNGATGLIRGAGTINGNLTVSGGTIAPGNSGIGTLTVYGGTLTVDGAATFAVDLGGTSADKIAFQYPPSNVDLGSGLLTLSLNLLNEPTANTTYNLITISGGSSTLRGGFAGLPNSGDTLTAMFGGNPFTFSLNYQSNLVSLTYNPVLVPEPSTYALMAAGLIAIVAGYRRRRR